MKKAKTIKFDFDKLPDILGSGIKVIEREVTRLAEASEKNRLTDAEAKVLIAYVNALREVKKDHFAVSEAIRKEFNGYSDEQLKAALQKGAS